MNIKVVCDDKIPFLKGILENAGFDAVYRPGSKISPDDVRSADAMIVRTRTRCNAQLLAGANVKFIATATIGFDHLDLPFLKQNNIAWTNAPGCNADGVAQYIASCLVKYGTPGMTLGVIGVGEVGRRVAKTAQILGFNTLLNDPPRMAKEGAEGFTGLEELLHNSDIVTVHIPGGGDNVNFANERFFRNMKKGAIFINSSRGEVVDEEALKNAISEQRPEKIILDVWRNEPDIDSFLMNYALEATPHIAGYSTDGKANATLQSVRSLGRFFGVDTLANYSMENIPVPPPENPRFALPDQEQIKAAVLHSYDAGTDTALLRGNPRSFEELRGKYRTRREFHAYTLTNVKPESISILSALGFNLEK